jgi:hypothetical protein
VMDVIMLGLPWRLRLHLRDPRLHHRSNVSTSMHEAWLFFMGGWIDDSRMVSRYSSRVMVGDGGNPGVLPAPR